MGRYVPKMDAAMRDFTSKRKQDDLPEEQVRKHQVKVMCWRAFKTDHLCALNFDQAFLHRI